MKKEDYNYNIQLILFPGICIIGLLVSFLMKNIIIMPYFFGISLFIRAIFSFLGKIYGRGHWYSKKECIFDGILFIILGIIGEVELLQYIYKNT